MRQIATKSAPFARPGAASPARLTRRAWLAAAAGLAAAWPRDGLAFGEEGAFHPRVLVTGTSKHEGARATAAGRWSSELVTRTSAPARLTPSVVRPDDKELSAEPFAWWIGDTDVAALTAREVRGLRQFFALGGVLLVDDAAPEAKGGGAFTKAAKRELARVLPEGSPVAIGPENVVFRSFYLLKRAVGRVEGPPTLEAILKKGQPQVLFSAHDLAGALARGASGTPPFAVTPGGDAQREQAIRLAVNVSMYVLCSNYKDDQVHAPFLMRRRGAAR